MAITKPSLGERFLNAIGLVPEARAEARLLQARLKDATYARLAVGSDRTAQYPQSGRHPVLQITKQMPGRGIEHEVQLLVCYALRRYLPVVQEAIQNRRDLEGTLYVESQDQRLADRLNEFAENVPVGRLAGRAALRGLNTYVNGLAAQTDTYGLSAGEMLVDEQVREIERLVIPNTRTLSIDDRNADGFYEVYHTPALATARQNATPRRIDDSPFVQLAAFSMGDETIWPYPMLWGMDRLGETLLRLYEAVKNAWWRFGDPSMLFGIEFGPDAQPTMTEITVGSGAGAQTVEAPSALVLLKTSIEEVMKARRVGKVGDAYVAADGGSIKSEVIGSVDSAMTKFFREHESSLSGHVIAASRTPVFMYPWMERPGDGLGGQLSQNEAVLAGVAARKRNEEKIRLFREVLDMHLILSGDARYLGRYEIASDVVSVVDDKMIAETEKAQAEADAQVIENVVQGWDEEGNRRFRGEAEQVLVRHGIYQE